MSNFVQRRHAAQTGSVGFLTAEEETALARARKAGDKTAGEKLAQAFRPLLRSETYRWSKHYTHLDREDVFAAVQFGFVKALDKFDPDRGVRFSTYALPWIKAQVQEEAQGASKVRAAAKTDEARAVFAAVSRALDKQEGASLNKIYGDVAEARGIGVERVKRIHESTIYIISGDGAGKRKNGEESSSIFDAIADPAPQAANLIEGKSMMSLLRAAVGTLPPRQKYIIAARFGLMRECAGEPRTLEQVGNTLGITKERTRQLEVKGLQQLRRHFEAKGFEFNCDLFIPEGKVGHVPPIKQPPKWLAATQIAVAEEKAEKTVDTPKTAPLLAF